MEGSYALKIETRSFPPFYHFGFKTKEEIEYALELFQKDLQEGWKASIVIVPDDQKAKILERQKFEKKEWSPYVD
jgi:hypothetical protein